MEGRWAWVLSRDQCTGVMVWVRLAFMAPKFEGLVPSCWHCEGLGGVCGLAEGALLLEVSFDVSKAHV